VLLSEGNSEDSGKEPRVTDLQFMTYVRVDDSGTQSGQVARARESSVDSIRGETLAVVGLNACSFLRINSLTKVRRRRRVGFEFGTPENGPSPMTRIHSVYGLPPPPPQLTQ